MFSMAPYLKPTYSLSLDSMRQIIFCLTEQQMITHIDSKLKEFDLKYLQTLMREVKRKLRSIADKGIFLLYKN